MRKLAFSLLVGLIMLFPMSAIAVAQNAKTEACRGVGLVSGTGDCSTVTGSPSVSSVLATALNLLSIVVGIVAVAMIIYGGLRFILSSGEPSNTSNARN